MLIRIKKTKDKQRITDIFGNVYRRRIITAFLFLCADIRRGVGTSVYPQAEGGRMVNLFADIPEELVESTLQTIRENLDKVGLYGGHTLCRHADVQLMVLKTRLTKEDIRYATSYWDREVAAAVVRGLMRRCYDSEIVFWLKYSGSDCISLIGNFSRTIGYGFRKGEDSLNENLRKACLVLIKDPQADWGFRILTSYPMF